MGCGCGAGASSSVASITSPRISSAPITFSGECIYTFEQVQDWLEKLNCFNNNGLISTIPSITQRKLNMYIGIVLSAINYASNVCYFKSQLDEVQSFITIVISTGQC